MVFWFCVYRLFNQQMSLSEYTDEVELVKYHPEQDLSCSDTEDGCTASVKVKRKRRRRKRGAKKSDSTTLFSAASILSSAAKESIESSPSSFATNEGGAGRKMSALELDDIIEEEENAQVLTSTTGTPGSLDSSQSLWELGTIEADEDEILSFDRLTPRPIIRSLRMQSAASTEDVDSLTAGIEALMQSIPSLSGKDMRRMCLGSSQPRSNRLCIDNVPRVDFSAISGFFGSVSSHLVDTVEVIRNRLIEAQFAQPESVAHVLASLDTRSGPPGVIPSSSIPVVNRRQRRAIEREQNVYRNT